jgi:metal-responsive CopG/Arc/MetJ family transcriptional regulator
MPKQIYSVRLKKDMVQELDRIAKIEVRSRNSLIELAIHKYLKDVSKNTLQSS